MPHPVGIVNPSPCEAAPAAGECCPPSCTGLHSRPQPLARMSPLPGNNLRSRSTHHWCCCTDAAAVDFFVSCVGTLESASRLEGGWSVCRFSVSSGHLFGGGDCKAELLQLYDTRPWSAGRACTVNPEASPAVSFPWAI